MKFFTKEVQIIASSSRQRFSKSKLKGQGEAKCYEEGGFYKYTVGETEDYDEIVKVREALVENFPEAFIIAFKGSQRIDTRAAIREFRASLSGVVLWHEFPEGIEHLLQFQ